MAGDDDEGEPGLSPEKLLRLQDLASIGRVGSGVTHEVRNIMTGILGFAQMARDKLQSRPERSAELLAMIEQETVRCLELLTGFLSFSRVNTKDFSPVSLNDVAEAVARIVKPQLALSQIRLQLELQPRLHPVRGRSGQLQQVVLNLALNAQQSMTEAGRRGLVTIATRSTGERVELRVSDGGPGVPEAQRARIFQAFYTTKATGTGLGLALAAGTMREHAGTLSLESSSETGATFLLSLPLWERGEAD